jgi:hypothetical protein
MGKLKSWYLSNFTTKRLFHTGSSNQSIFTLQESKPFDPFTVYHTALSAFSVSDTVDHHEE